MSRPITVDILSDDDEDEEPKWQMTAPPNNNAVSTPLSPQSKRQRIQHFSSNPTILLIDDEDPTPTKTIVPVFTPSPIATGKGLSVPTLSPPLIVAETPMMLESSNRRVAIAKCNGKGLSISTALPSSTVAETPMLNFSKSVGAVAKRNGKGLSVPTASPPSIVAETPTMLDFLKSDGAVVKCNSMGLSDTGNFSGAKVPTSMQSIVAETPMLDFSKPDVAIVKHNSKKLSDPKRFSVPNSTPSIVVETPMLDLSSPNTGIVKRNSKGLSDPQKFSGICGLICLESDNESEYSSRNENWKQSDTSGGTCDAATDSELSSSLVGSESSPEEKLLAHENLTQMSVDSCSLQISSEDGSTQANYTPAEEIDRPELTENIKKRKSRKRVNANKENDVDDGNKKRTKTKEEKDQHREREKLQKEPMKVEAAAMKAEAARVRLKEENNQLIEREKLQKEAMKAEAVRVRMEEENNQIREREKLQKETMEAEAARVRLMEENNQLREREKLQKEAMKAEYARVRMEEENNLLREREKLEKETMTAVAARLRLEEENNQLREREKLQKETMKAKAEAEAELNRLRLKEENNQLREREKLQKEAMKAEAVKLRLKEENNQLREREKLQKETMKAKAEAELNKLRLKEEKKQLREREKFQKSAMKAEAARLRLKEEKDQLRDREKLQKEAMKAEAELKRAQLKEEKNQLKEREKLQKAAMKAEAPELKKLEKEKQKWEKGKFALNSIVANVDAKVVELGSVGGHLLSRFAEKGLTYRITSNPIERSIVWNMAVPDQISKLPSNSDAIPYVLLLVEAEEFCNLVINETLMEHVSSVRSRYRSHTICYVTNRLMAFINKREQEQYKNPDKFSSWRRPPVEEVLAKLSTHFVRVHSRQCIDEAELAEHVVGLTCSLASCRFRKKLTRLSVNANGSLIPKDCIDKDLFKKNSWLKALIAIPKVQPRFALAIQKKYPTMRSLLNVYMDPNKSVHEKEFLLKELTIEGLLGDNRRLGEVCSKRVYRILTAQSGSSYTDDVEDGADFFSRTSTTPS